MALGHRQVQPLQLDRRFQEVAVRGDDHELLPRRQEQTPVARRSAVLDAEAVLAGLHLEVGHRGPVDCRDVTQPAVGLERVEDRQGVVRAAVRVAGELDVVEHQRDVVLPAGQVPCVRVGIVLVVGVELVEDEVEARQARVDVRRGEVQPMVVVPERGQLLAVVASRRIVRVVVVPVEARVLPVPWIAVTLRCGVGVVEVGRGRRQTEPETGVGRQVVVPAEEDGLAVVSVERRARRGPLPAPRRHPAQLRMVVPQKLLLVVDVVLLRRKVVVALVARRIGRRRQRLKRHRLRDRWDVERCDERLDDRARRHGVRREPVVQAELAERLLWRGQASAGRDQAQLQDISSRGHQVSSIEIDLPCGQTRSGSSNRSKEAVDRGDLQPGCRPGAPASYLSKALE